MKNWISYLMFLLVSVSAYSYTSQSINQTFDIILKSYKLQNNKIVWNQLDIQQVNSLTDEERFKIAIMLRDKKILPQSLFDYAQKYPMNLKEMIEKEEPIEDRDLKRLTLYLISGIS